MSDWDNFNWDSAEEWTVSQGVLLGKGNWVTEILSAEKGKSSKGNHQIEIEYGCNEGTIREWLVVTTGTVGKLLSLSRGTGVNLSNEVKQFVSANNGEVPDNWAKALVGKRVGIIVRDEDDDRNPGKTRPRVQSHVPPEEIRPLAGQGSIGVTNANGTGAVASADPGPASPHPAEQKDIPF